jgi:hypothetical protein
MPDNTSCRAVSVTTSLAVANGWHSVARKGYQTPSTEFRALDPIAENIGPRQTLEMAAEAEF